MSTNQKLLNEIIDAITVAGYHVRIYNGIITAIDHLNDTKTFMTVPITQSGTSLASAKDNFIEIISRFDLAAKNVQYPKLTLNAEDGSLFLLRRAGASAKYPYSVNILPKDGEGWFGRITREGVLHLGQQGKLKSQLIINMLTAFQHNPRMVAQIYGHEYNHCCFCQRTLTNAVSVELGYGPICAETWGLPHDKETVNQNANFDIDAACNMKDSLEERLPITSKPQIETIMPGIRQCLDCGATAENNNAIEHYTSCKPGEAKRWEKHYEKENEVKPTNLFGGKVAK